MHRSRKEELIGLYSLSHHHHHNQYIYMSWGGVETGSTHLVCLRATVSAPRVLRLLVRATTADLSPTLLRTGRVKSSVCGNRSEDVFHRDYSLSYLEVFRTFLNFFSIFP